MEILTAAAMRRVDARAIQEHAIPGQTLMEAAGTAVAESIAAEIPEVTRRRVIVVCGKGNNGGDGLVAARQLVRLGIDAHVVLAARSAELEGDAGVNLLRALDAGVPVEELDGEESWTRLADALDAETVVVDALLGTGTKGRARGPIARAIKTINARAATVLSIDVPSGVDTDSGTLTGPTVRAHRTLTLCRPKPCLVLEPAASHAGPWDVLDIGIPDEAVAAEPTDLEWIDVDAAAALMPGRPPDAHKGTMGHLLVFAGSRGKSGAAVLVARAALRSGVGLVTVATSAAAQPIVAASQSELMTEALSGNPANGVLKLSAARDALAIGPGLGTAPGTRAAIPAILAGRSVPAVLDADGLNAFAHGGGRRRPLRAGRHALVLTPHPGEAARLLGTTAAEVQADRLGVARKLAAATGAVVVLKGRRSVVAHPDGRAAFNATGNAGMATGGTGDALTGVLGSLLARGISGFDAARLGTYVHGDAGDIAAGRLGEDGLIAGDLIDALPEAWRRLADRRRG